MQRLMRRPEPPSEGQGPLYADVKLAMTEVQAYARSHGGAIELVSVSDSGDVTVKMSGACSGCPMSTITLKLGIESQLKLLVPGVGRVIQLK